MIGIVVVSHSRALAKAAVDLASEMLPPTDRPAIEIAAGLDDETFGTDAQAIADAITTVDSPDGVAVLVDLGSAILSSEMALELLAPPIAGHVKIASGPLVEGLVAASVTAATGANLETVIAEANAGLTAKIEHLGEVAQAPAQAASPTASAPGGPAGGPPLTLTVEVTNEHGLHARPAAALVAGLRGLDAVVQLTNATTGKGPAPATSLAGVSALGLRRGQMLSASITGPDAALARSTLKYLAEEGFGESTGADPATAAEVDAELNQPGRSGRQIGVGPARHFSTAVDTSAYRPGDATTERNRLDQAIAGVLGRLNAQAQLPGDHAQVFGAQAILLEDPELISTLHAGVAQNQSALAVVEQDFTALAAELAALDDPYLRERAQDITSLAHQITAELMGVQLSPGRLKGIVIVDELDPLTATALHSEHCLGVVTCSGGATGHGVMIAASRGIPVVTGKAVAKDIPDNTVVGLDPVQGRIWINPTMADLAELERLAVERRNEATLASELRHQPALTSSGRRILVEANIGSFQDAKTAAANGADGSGLVRTEILFEDWDHAPSAEEQAGVFLKLSKGLGGTMMTVRTWDPGGDKPLSFLPQEPEVNPMLGERGLRAMKRRPELLVEQLRAIGLASRRVPIRVMFPMVADVDEVVWATDLLRAALAETGGHAPVGIMVETPAAALRAADFAALVDFISIGTNDLTQYTMAADRGNAAVADLLQGQKRAVWDLIDMAARAFAGRPVAVCGDMASEPDLTASLVGLGVTELSVRPPLVGLVKLAVRTRA